MVAEVVVYSTPCMPGSSWQGSVMRKRCSPKLALAI
jgi:hypothetical protein